MDRNIVERTVKTEIENKKRTKTKKKEHTSSTQLGLRRFETAAFRVLPREDGAGLYPNFLSPSAFQLPGAQFFV